jgi:5-methylcytosine-specific restriction endonuclease McrA
MDCRNRRARLRQERIKQNGNAHTDQEWMQLLDRSPTCAVCGRAWSEFPPRLDARYKNVWTKGHIVPVLHGGPDSTDNIQAACYQCNFRKNAGKLKR